jgi:glycosyltransferase involved in cell wall biosynthesis
MKNVAMIAFDCDPYKESESLVSFELAFNMSKQDYHITMITRPQFKEHIEKYLSNIEHPNLIFIYIDSIKYHSKYNNAKGFLKDYYISKYIDDFFKNVNYELHKINSLQPLDIIHKVTPNSYRKIIDLSDFSKALRIYGPCGGAQETPQSLLKSLTFKAKLIEFIHRLLNRHVLKSLNFKKAINSYDIVLCTNLETKATISPLLFRDKQCSIITDVGIEKVIGTKEIQLPRKVFTMLWIGRMIPRKGLSLLFDALALVNRPYRFVLVGDGPERKELEKKAKKKGLSSKIEFYGYVDHNKVKDFYEQADLFVFPSLRESSGNVLIESISYGVPVLAFYQGGAPYILGKSGLYIYTNGKTYLKITNEIANKITFLVSNPSAVDKLRLVCLEEAKKLQWINKCQEISSLYQEKKV